MTDAQVPPSVLVAVCGTGTIDGMAWRPGDPVKHLGPPFAMAERQSAAFYSSRLFATRCGLGARYPDGSLMGWRRAEWHENDDCWCPACLVQAGIPHTVEDWLADEDGDSGSQGGGAT